MPRTLIIFALLVGVGLQTLPLRVCAVEEAIAGRSCHDHDEAAAVVERATNRSPVALDLDGHAGAAGEQERTCRCQMPKGGVDRHVRLDVPIDLLPSPIATFDLGPAFAGSVMVPAFEQPPNVATASVSLPLLI